MLIAAALGALTTCDVRRDLTVPIPANAEQARAGTYTRPLGAAVEAEYAREDERYLRAFLSTFTSLTPENAMKWNVVQPGRSRWDFAAADALVELAQRTGKRVRGHPAAWDQQLPPWLTEEDWEPEELAGVLRDHVSRLVGRYRGRVATWDVVNEPLAEDGTIERNIFGAALGEEWVDIAFRAARAADPQARLYLNEIAAEGPSAKGRGLFELARRLKQRGVPIDGIGLQNHTTARDHPSKAMLGRAMRRFARLGLEVEITEMDVVVPAGPAALERQADAYAAAAEACAEAPNCRGLTVWGVTDRYSWKGAAARPLLFDDAAQPKPALPEVTGRLRP